MVRCICSLLMIMVLLTSCQRLGPYVVAPERLSYNRVIQYNEKQQVLLNIVRLRYGDTPLFVSLDSLVSQFQFQKSASLDLLFTSPLTGNTVEPNIGVSFSESPTLTYIPLTGAEYIKRFLTPINVRVVYSLLQSSWGANHVFRLMLQRIGNYENATGAARSVSSRLPEYKEFLKLGNALRLIEKQNNLGLDYQNFDKVFAIKLTFNHYSSYPAEWKKQLKKLQVSAAVPYVWLIDQKIAPRPHVVFIQTRTTLGLLNYLSKGVELPPEHIKQEFAPQTRLPNGGVFNWTLLTQGTMKIKYSTTHPKNYYTAIEYKGYWFYIEQSDSNSKETLSLFSILMEANHNNNYRKAPVFTIS